ncbi:hypothetical protein GOP47_0006125 [Adiantum capillus-veneris]|uniref:HRDC domain-containing protein n=1 Tax=Adiantum capillus-veneris TaxID=13818 RepID=A0A9D4V2N6_ADICA|nr:hypothetical protein GOP47_0006125 [Adiantum capillus-veneris]
MADHVNLAGGEEEEVKVRLVAETTQLVESAERLERASRLLPTHEDFHFYSNFPEFREPVQGIESRVNEILSQLSSLRTLSRAPVLPTDVDEYSDWLVSMQDELLEQRRRDLLMKETKPLPEVGGKAVTMQPEKCPVPFHVWSIPRPQDKFDVPVDNSNTPFRHPRQNNQPEVSIHPLQEELQNMTFEDVPIGVIEPKQPASLEQTPFTFVNSPSLLEDTAAKLALEREIAVDLEHHQFRSFQGLTCLMQISTRSEDFIIDTLELRSIIGRYLYDIFSSSTIQKVMHGATLDVMWLQRDFGIYVCNLFDTGQAARVLELESFGLAHLLTRFCGFTPDKRYQMADWRLRPLPVEMIKYAREDTHYLLYIADLLKQKLLSLQSENQQVPLLEVFKRSRDLCLKLYEKEITTETSYLQVYGLEERKFNSQQLAVLSGLYLWRDQIARIEDESTGYVLPNHLLLKLAEEMPDDVKQLRTMLNGRHTIVARNSAMIVNVIKKMKSSQRPITEGRPSLEVVANKPRPIFEEVAFFEDSPGTSVAEEERNNLLSPEKGSYVIAENPELQGDQDSFLGQVLNGISGDSIADATTKAAKGLVDVANVVVNRASKSLLFGMQEVTDKDLDRLAPKSMNRTDVSAGGEKFLKDVPASGVIIKRASGSSLFMKAKKVNRVVQEVQDTPMSVGIEEPLKVACTDRQKASTHGREVDDLASMLGNRTTLQLEVGGSTHSDDFEQAEAKSRAEKIRASFALPFHSFSGGDSLAQRHTKVAAAEQVFDQDKETESKLEETEDVIFLEGDTSEEAEKTTYIVNKGISIGSDGVRHRLWWPDSLGSAEAPSLDTREEGPCDVINSSSLQMELPVPLSQKYRQQRPGMYYKLQSSQVSTTNASDVGQEERQSYKHTSVTPFDYAAAKKNMGLSRGHSGAVEQVEGSSPARFNEGSRRESTERIFDPKRSIKEFKAEGITPGKRRQVFPQSGNRTGVFK